MKDQAVAGPFGGRWFQLLVGIICMSMIANLQYGWTLFVNPIDAKFGWGRAAIQVAHGWCPSRDTSLINLAHAQ
jgi:OFA family oxalate/formate antiporter-like MFS transporter